MSWIHLQAMRVKLPQRFSPLFAQSTSELVAVLGGGDGAKYTLDLVINAADDRMSCATVTPTPSLAAVFNQASKSQKPYLLSEFTSQLQYQIALLAPSDQQKAELQGALFNADGSLHSRLNFKLDPTSQKYSWVCAFCPPPPEGQAAQTYTIAQPLNYRNLFRHFHNIHFNKSLIPHPASESASSAPSSPSAPSPPSSKKKRTNPVAPAPATPSSPSAPAARTLSGTGAPSHL